MLTILPELDRREGEKRAENPDDPEANDNLGLVPAQHLEVVV
jgi:hypothetical protein